MKKKILKLFALNALIIFINILAFSSWCIGLTIGKSVIQTLISIFLIIISAIAFFKGNNIILNGRKKSPTKVQKKLVSDEDFKMELLKCMDKHEFKSESTQAIEQIERLRKKTDTLDLILQQHFEKDSLTYEKFHYTIINIEKLFFENLRKMILKITIFDQDEYNNLAKENKNISESAALQRNAIFKEYINYVNTIIEKNEGILIKLDNLTLEISKLEDVNDVELDNLPTIQEMNTLIEQTKLYKQEVTE